MIYICKAKKNKKKTIKLKVEDQSLMIMTEGEFKAYQERIIAEFERMRSEYPDRIPAMLVGHLIHVVLADKVNLPKDVIV